MRPTPPLLRFIPLLFLLAFISGLGTEKPVLANSSASREYLKNRMVDGKRQPQSYVFMAGRHFSGTTHDNSLANTSFRTIAERLAQDLVQQDFHPAPSLAKADLLLVVHWGVTAGKNRDAVDMTASMENLATMNIDGTEAQRNLDAAVAQDDFYGAMQARGVLSNLENATKSEIQNINRSQSSFGGENSAALLGLTADLNRDDDSLFDYERRKTLFEMTREECYFIIVMAYDAQTLIKTKKLKRVWTQRTSINSAGVNFPQALDRIGNVASHYFGTRQDRVSFDYPQDRKRDERVEIHDFIVLGPADR